MDAARAREAAGATMFRPPEPRPRPGTRANREPPAAAAAARPREPRPGPGPSNAHAAKPRTAREDPVARMPEPRPGAEPAAEGRAVREAPVATVPRPPEPRPRVEPAADGRTAREAPVANVPRPPERRPAGPPYYAEEGCAAPVAAAPRPPEPRPAPSYPEEGRAAPVAAATRPPEPRHEPYYPPEHPVLYYPLDRPARRSSALSSCLLATAFLLLAVGGAATALFLLFRLHPPDISVAAVRLPSFAAANGTIAFTFEQMASVRNPNRAPLAHFDSSLRVAYAGGELGSVYIPAGLIDGGRTKDMSASFAVPAFPAATPPPQEIAASAEQQPAAMAVMEVDSLLVVKGKLTVLRVLTHRVVASKVCRVGVSPVDGRVLGFRC